MEKSYGVAGGDRRQAELVLLLRENGRKVCSCGLEEWGVASSPLEEVLAQEIVIFPLPLCKGSGELNLQGQDVTPEEAFRHLTPHQHIFGGQVSPTVLKAAKEQGLEITDYFRREEMTILNAAATAEAALTVAQKESERMLLNTDCLVIGFGRIGKLLCQRLSGIGARVSAAARSATDRAWIQALGWQAMDTGHLSGKLGSFQTVFNTVPAPVLGPELLTQLRQDCLCVELSSVEGIDLAAARKLGLASVWARALPGRMVPRSAAKIIYDTIEQCLQEGGNLS